MKTAVQELFSKLEIEYPSLFNTHSVDGRNFINEYYQFLELEKQQIIDAGNSCAIKQHLHSDMIDKMSNAECMVFTQTDNLTFGEQYYNETFKTN